MAVWRGRATENGFNFISTSNLKVEKCPFRVEGPQETVSTSNLKVENWPFGVEGQQKTVSSTFQFQTWNLKNCNLAWKVGRKRFQPHVKLKLGN